MLKAIKHVVNLATHHFNEAIVGAKRSGEWPTVEKHFKETHPTCAACGTTINIQVHHKIPFHLDRKLELDPTNLISLCMSARECHLQIGHCGSWKLYSPMVEKNAAEALAHPDRFEAIVKRGSVEAKKN
jgi:hypothetical protein